MKRAESKKEKNHKQYENENTMENRFYDAFGFLPYLLQ